MGAAARALIDHNQQLLAVLQTRAHDDLIPALMQRRAERLQAFGAAVAAGELVPAEEVGRLRQLEHELIDCVLRRREVVAHELAALHRRRNAERVYLQESARRPRFLDRAG